MDGWVIPLRLLRLLEHLVVLKRELGKETSQNWLHKLTLVAIRGSKVVFMHYKTKGKKVSNEQYGLEEKDLNQPPIYDGFFIEISIFL